MILALSVSFNLLCGADFSQPTLAGRVGMVLLRGTTHDGGPGFPPSPARPPLFLSNLLYSGGEYYEV
jgi:hypothetical protein